MAFGFFVWLTTTFLAVASAHYLKKDGSFVWILVRQLLPQGHRVDLWRTDAAHLINAGAFLIALAFMYLLAGYSVFRKRDL